jgi:hypothetical protein
MPMETTRVLRTRSRYGKAMLCCNDKVNLISTQATRYKCCNLQVSVTNLNIKKFEENLDLLQTYV